MNMHFISVDIDLTEIPLDSTTSKVAFWKHYINYHQFPGAS